jgi:hypothetical protein
MCEAAGHRGAVQEALTYHGRWILAKFPRVTREFYGQLSYSSFGRLAIQYEDSEAYDGVSVRQVRGLEPLVGHSRVRLLPAGAVVPEDVFLSRGWLVEPDT